MRTKLIIFLLIILFNNSAEALAWLVPLLNKNEKLSEKFFIYKPFFDIKKISINCIENDDILDLLEEVKGVSTNSYKSINDLEKLGFKLNIVISHYDKEWLKEAYGNEFLQNHYGNNWLEKSDDDLPVTEVHYLNEIVMDDYKRFVLVCSGETYLYLIDTQSKPIKTWLLDENCTCPNKIDKVLKRNEESFRFIYREFPGNGRLAGAPRVEVKDIDFNKKILAQIKGNYLEDINKDGNPEVIISNELDFNINWYWIFRYENGEWVESSNRYPEYYKSAVKNILEEQYESTKKTYIELKNNSHSKSVSSLEYRMKELFALIEIAKFGGISEYLKKFHAGETF